MDYALTGVDCISFTAKDYIWGQNDNGPLIRRRKKEAAPCSVNGATPPLLNLIKIIFKKSYFILKHDVGHYHSMDYSTTP